MKENNRISDLVGNNRRNFAHKTSNMLKTQEKIYIINLNVFFTMGFALQF